MKEKISFLLAIIIILSFAALSGFSLLRPGLPPTHDGEYHIIRFYEFDKVLREGNWYPRWAPDLNNGFGVPLFNYVYPLPNYIASFLHLFNISFIDAFKFQMFIAIIIGAVFFYLWSKIFWGNLGGVVSSMFYTFAPYHFVDIYIRGSVGEVWALALFPIFLWSITKYIKYKNKLFIPLSAIFLALVIFSHNILALMFFIFSIFYGLFLIVQNENKKSLLINFCLIIVFGLGLSSIFWLPALLEQKYVQGLQIYDITENFPETYQLMIPSWGSGFSGSDLKNQMSFQIGMVHLLGVMLSFILLILPKKNTASNNNLTIFFLSWFFIIFLLMLKASLPIWKTVPFMAYFQFPWRLLSLEILIASFLAGSIFSIYKSKFFALTLISLLVFLSFGYTKPAYYHQRNDNYYISRSNFIDGTNSVGNYFNTIWFNNRLQKQKNKLELGQNDKIFSEKIESQKYNFNLFFDKPGYIIVNTAYFPGWAVFINGKEEKISSTADGRIVFNAPEGLVTLKIELLPTISRKVSTSLSLLAFAVLIILLKRNWIIKK